MVANQNSRHRDGEQLISTRSLELELMSSNSTVRTLIIPDSYLYLN